MCIPYRRTTCVRTCVPSPSRNLPRVASCSSHAVAAVTNGLRGNATATPVDSSSSGAACDATAALRYAVRPVSVNSNPENPAACTRPAKSPILFNGCGVVIASTCTVEQYAECQAVTFCNARAEDGDNYRVLADVSSLSAAPIGPGGSTTGKVYFDVVGATPNSVVFDNGSEDILGWVTPPGV